ncbi:alpha/beta hydrolase [Natrinema hispanicum]|uniref:Phospholipase/carboxylesterase n=1 Tax=Natrinema hispanicum TaxID=392421 RepID=A0A1G6R114_9EURY|nr:dienelactone hydrolase family protein [Natrinema hispanicum]SDC97924.1 phospholipase/carboxylesterase [Natrinema hispanicum]SET73406.1 phospholipase/carboxylesterase [Natrinema hispanicum]
MSAGEHVDGPHQGQQLATAGTDLEDAEAALVCTHGRGATARGMLQLAADVIQEGVAVLAPQAARQTWYPSSFLAPVEQNEPGRRSGLQAISDAINEAADAGIPTERVMLIGFSQGACLASEYLARNPRRYGGLAALSGGLIGETLDDEYPGDLEGTPVFLGCSDTDPYIPKERVHETAAVLESMDADVTKRLYEGMGHGINEDELAVVSEMVTALIDV